MQYIVLDLEWNQALSKDLVRTKDFVLTGEIIEIGAVRLDAQFRPEGLYRRIVTPKVYRKMHWSVRKLTGITSKNLERGLPFPEAFAEFMNWCGDDFAFLTWGPDDLPMMNTNLRLHRIEAPEMRSFDLQRIYSRAVSGERRQCSLSDALAHLEVTDVYPPHDALNDALNTSVICRFIDMEDALANYEEPVKPEKEPQEELPPGEALEYESMEALGRACAAFAPACESCGETLSFGKWVRRSPSRRIALAECVCGKSYIAGIRWRENEEDGRVSASRTLRKATESQKNAYQHLLRRRRRTRRRAGSEDAGEAPDAGPDNPGTEAAAAAEEE